MDPHLGLTEVEGQNRYTTSNESTPQQAVGSFAVKRVFDRPAAYMYVKAGAALADGQIVSLGLNHDDADVDAAATTSESTLTGTSDFTADEFGGHGGLVAIDSGGGLKHGGHYIKRNTANILYTDRNWGEALTTASDYITHMLNKVVLADIDAVATSHVCGVAIGTVTSGNYCWIQIAGVHWRVRTVGTTDAIVLGEKLMASGTAGVAKGWTAGGTTAEDVAYSFGVALAPDSEADAASEGVPALLTDCAKFWGL